jgi:uroporphyrinogen decarboxylase
MKGTGIVQAFRDFRQFHVERNLRLCGARGGIVIGPTHLVEPEVPWANLLAMKEACEQFQL